MISKSVSRLTENGMFLITIAVGMMSSSPPGCATPPGEPLDTSCGEAPRKPPGGGLPVDETSVGGDRDRPSGIECPDDG